MGVIKQGRLSHVPAFSFADVERQANEIISRAKAHAHKIVSESEGHIREVTEQHRHQGYEVGFKEGKVAGFETARQEARETAVQAAEAELKQLIDALTHGLQEYEQRKHTLLAGVEIHWVNLALSVARRVCKHTAEHAPEVVRANAQALLEMARHHGDIELHVNPTEHELVDIETPALAEHVRGLDHVMIVADPDVERGGCILKTKEGTIDARIATQLERIAQVLSGSVDSDETEPDDAEPDEAES
jgi:flagellar assembly protein FliH